MYKAATCLACDFVKKERQRRRNESWKKGFVAMVTPFFHQEKKERTMVDRGGFSSGWFGKGEQ